MGTPSAGSATTEAAVEASSTKAHNDNASSTTVTAQDIVDAFKANGSFDAARNELLKSFTASEEGKEFDKRTQDIINDTLSGLYERPQQSTGSSTIPMSSTSAGFYTSPTRYGLATRSKQDATNHILKTLERNTAYDRATDNVRPFLLTATKSLDDDLANLYDKLKAAKEATTEIKEVRTGRDKDAEMAID